MMVVLRCLTWVENDDSGEELAILIGAVLPACDGDWARVLGR